MSRSGSWPDNRILIVGRLLETLPDELPGWSMEDAGFLEEMERRANDGSPVVPLSELWKQD
jgi:hypothetical protein